MITEILKSIENTSSSNGKIAILEQNKNNQILKELLSYTYDTIKYTYGMKFHLTVGMVENRNGQESIDENWNTLEAILRSRYNKYKGVTETESNLRTLCQSLNPDSQWVIKKILDRDLGIGISGKTINKVWPKLIPEWPVMLCDTYNEKTSKNIKFPAIVQCKADGMRVNIVCKNDGIEYRSRNGKLFKFSKDMDLLFQSVAQIFGEYVLDGEILAMTNDGVCDRSTGNGIAGKALKGTISKQEEELLLFKLWDCIPFSEFTGRTEGSDYYGRLSKLEWMLSKLENERIQLVPSDIVPTIEDAMILYQQYLKDGEEGIIIKSMEASWQPNRSKFALKVKAEIDVDLVVCKVVPGEPGTKYENCLGALLCESSDLKLSVSVGSGFADEQRKTITSENSIGKIVKVRANCVISNKNTEIKSLFLPRFLEFRDDKIEADSLDTIIKAFKS
jgi:ATP-dependent DNA ligase